MFFKGEEKMYSRRSKLLTIVSLGTMMMLLVGCAAPAQNPTAAPAQNLQLELTLGWET